MPVLGAARALAFGAALAALPLACASLSGLTSGDDGGPPEADAGGHGGSDGHIDHATSAGGDTGSDVVLKKGPNEAASDSDGEPREAANDSRPEVGDGGDANDDGPVDAERDTGRDAGRDAGHDAGIDGGGPPAFLIGALGPSRQDLSAVSAAETDIGDLLLICIYIEPNNEMDPTASYPALSPPAGFTLATWEPIASNDSHITSQGTNRQYVFWGYATTAGAASYNVASTPDPNYADTVVVTVHGYTRSGYPFADTPGTGVYGDGPDGGDGVTAYPSVSVTPAASDTGFLWFGTAWYQAFAVPVGYTLLVNADDISLGSYSQGVAQKQTVAPTFTDSQTLLTASLMSFR